MAWFRKLVARHRALEREVTEQQSLAVGQQRLAALVRNSADVVLVCDLASSVSYASPSIRAVLGVDEEAVIGSMYTDLVHPDDLETFVMALTTVPEGEDDVLHSRMVHADGRVLHVEGTVTNLIADDSVGGLVVTFRDVTQRVDLEKQLTHQAFHDPLSGLANRQLFSDRLTHALVPRSGSPRARSWSCSATSTSSRTSTTASATASATGS